jgi:alpha-glucosidase (family GH31 glycosyl hydrolase)
MEIGGQGKHAPWDMPTDPRYDEEMIDIYRRYTRIRAALNGYIVSAARDAAAVGLPLARPLVFLDRQDEALRDLWDQYLFGPDLMVAPVWRSGARSRDVYFPAGRWRSLWDDAELYEGPATITVSAPLDVIPVYIRGAAPSPLAPSRQ